MLSVYTTFDQITISSIALEQAIKTASTLVTIVVIVFILMLLAAVTMAILKAFKGKSEPPKVEKEVEGESVDITLKDLIIDKDLRQRLEVLCNTTSEDERTLFENAKYKTPQGYLLYGPPGTGKTRIARAICGEAKARFFSVSGSDLYGKYSGESAPLIRNLFKMARKSAPSIIFIDEIDAIGGKRCNGATSVGKEYTQALAELLTQMDGFESDEGVIVIAATNCQDNLDPALIRPGRLTEHIHVSLPNKETRKEILDYYLEGVLKADNLDLQKIVEDAEGFSGADIEYLVNEAKYFAVQRIKEIVNESGEKLKIIITNDDLRKAFEKLRAQKEKSAETNVPETQMNLTDLFEYLSRTPVAPCVNCSA